jgi:t-SNARE complex subunit (syntaxin)
MKATLEYLKSNYEQAEKTYYDMQSKADNQIAKVVEAQRLHDSYRKAQDEADEKREKYLKMIQELDPNFVG